MQTDSGSPLALTGGMWALNARSEVTNVLGDYAEYWQPWADVVDGNGLPKQLVYLLRSIFMSTWGVWPAVFRPSRSVFPGLGAGFLNLGGKMGRTAKKRGKNEQKWARNGLKRVGAS